MQASLTQNRSLYLLFAATAGCATAVGLMWLHTLEPRYTLAGLAGLLLGAAGLTLLRYLPEVLLTALAFNLPFTGIEKSFFLQNQTTFVVGGVAVGLAEICVLTLYLLWFGRIFIAKTQPLPSPRFLDWCILAFWLAHVISAYSAESRTLVAVEAIRLGKYALACFYIVHNLNRRNLPFLLAGIFFALTLETGIAAVQYKTGKLLGIGQTKGAEKSYDQYSIDGFENVNRAEGTTFDSHALGLFCAMTLTAPLAVAVTRGMTTTARIVSAGVFLIGLQGLVISFARAGWVAFATAAGVTLFCIGLRQYRRSWTRAIPAIVVTLFLGAFALLPLIPKIRQRIVDAPVTLLTARVDTIEMGLDMWKPRALTGIGANNYMHALEREFSIFEGDPYFIPAHNMVVFILVELGILGLLAFALLSAGVVRAAWRAAKSSHPLSQCLAAALLGSFVALQVEGIFDPIYATNVTYFLVWFELGLIGGLERLTFSDNLVSLVTKGDTLHS